MVKIHIIHVGSVTNKGTLALVNAQVSELFRIYQEPQISVSSCDTEGLSRTTPEVISVPLLISIPHEKADLEAKRREIERESIVYLLLLLRYFIVMVVESFFYVAFAYLVRWKLISKAFNKFSTISHMAQSDIIISTADENFKEGSSNLPFNAYWRLVSWSILFSRALEVLVAKRILGKKIIVFPNSFGPFRTSLGCLFGKIVIRNVDMILLREKYSLEWIKKLGSNAPLVLTSDIALLSDLNHLISNQPPKFHESTITICPGLYAATLPPTRIKDYICAHAEALDMFIQQHNVKIVFLPLEVTGKTNDDYTFCLSILRIMKNHQKACIVKTTELREFTRQVEKAEMMLSSRMHPAVIAFSSLVPTAIVYYDFKQLGLMDQVGLSEYILDINEISSDALSSLLEKLWKNRYKINKDLRSRIPLLQKDIRNKIEGSCLRFLSRNKVIANTQNIKRS